MTERTKKLYRSRTDRVLFGVCGGLGDFFAIDPVFIRLIFLLLSLVDGIGVAIYFLLAVTIANEPKNADAARQGSDARKRIDHLAQSVAQKLKDDRPSDAVKRNAVALIIIIIGLFALAKPDPFTSQWLESDLVWPVALVLAGFYFIFRYNRR